MKPLHGALYVSSTVSIACVDRYRKIPTEQDAPRSFPSSTHHILLRDLTTSLPFVLRLCSPTSHCLVITNLALRIRVTCRGEVHGTARSQGLVLLVRLK